MSNALDLYAKVEDLLGVNEASFEKSYFPLF